MQPCLLVQVRETRTVTVVCMFVTSRSRPPAVHSHMLAVKFLPSTIICGAYMEGSDEQVSCSTMGTVYELWGSLDHSGRSFVVIHV